MDDKFNNTETKIVDFLNGIAAITDIANLVHVKLKDDPRNYLGHETPAVGVYASGFIGDGDDRHNSGINIYIEITDSGGDIDTADGNVKELMSLIIDYLRKESPVVSGAGIDAEFDDIFIADADVQPFQLQTGWMVSGNITGEVYIKE